MKHPALTPSAGKNKFIIAGWLALLVVGVLWCEHSRAADITWTGGTNGVNTGTAWRSATNWDSITVPTSADNAIFDSAGTVTTCAIDLGAAAGTQQIGAVTVGAGRSAALSIRNLTTSTTDGILRLNGVGGTVLSNASTTASLTFTNASTGKLLGLGLATDGTVYSTDGGGTAGQISVFSIISDVGGSRSITKTGNGIFYLRGVNTYSGTTTVLAGNLQVDDVGTIGIGTNTLFLSGGNLQSGANRNGTSSTPIANPIVITQDAYIQNKTGTATTRYLALSGTLSGSAGTLKIADPTSAVGNTFAVRFFNTNINFSRPMIVGEFGYDLASAFSVMETANTNGTQIFSGDISGVGSIRRLNPFTSGAAAGTTVFSGNNTYSGGTAITAGTLLANNSTGSALGSGAVTVTGLNSILGGNGSVVATTTVNTNATVSPGTNATTTANLGISDLTLGGGANFLWQIKSATGIGGTDWDLITCSSSWTDAASSGNPITIKIDSLGASPTGWNSLTARDYVIIQSSTANSFDASHFALDTTAFSGTIGGVFSLSVVSGALHLIYTPAADTVINVASGSVTQGGVSPTPYPNINVPGGIVKVGNGEVVLTNSANSYPGSTKIYAGTVSLAVDALNGSGAFGAAATAVQLGNITGNSNATLNINTAGVTMGRSVVVQSGSSGSKTIGTSITSGTATFSGDVALQDSASLTAPVGGSVNFSGNFTGAGGLTLGGGGAITLSAVNSYAGITTLGGGTLNLNDKGLGTNTFTISAVSTLDNTSASSVTLNNCPQNWNANFSFTGTTNLNLGSGPVTMSASRTLTVNASTLTVGGVIGGSAGLTKLGAGTLALSSSTNSTYTGGTTNAAGTISLNGTATFGDGTGTLALSGGNILSTATRSSTPISNSVVMSADTTIYGNSTATAPSSRIFPFNGNWTQSAGTLRVGNTGSSNNTFFVRLLAGSSFTGAAIVGDPAFDTPGAISVLQFYQDSNAPVQTVSGTISGNGQVWRGNLGVGAGGTSIVTGNNTFAGGFILNSGTLGLGLNSTPTTGVVTSGPLGTGTFEIQNDPVINIFAVGGARTIANNILLNGVTNTTFTGTNALTFNGSVNVGTVGKTLTVNNTAPVTFAGTMTNTAALTKAGSGTLIFSGDSSSRTNATTVNAGTLLINNPTGSGTGSGDVTVNSGGTLGGTGAIGGAVTVNAGGIISAGASIGTLTINSNLTLVGNVLVEVNKSLSPSNDLIVVNGLLTNAGTGTITVSNLGPALAVGNKFQIFSGAVANGGALAVTGGGVNWTNTLAVDGSIAVLSIVSSVNTNTFTIGASVSGNNLNLSWPPDRLGWKVQTQTNTLSSGLNTNWVTLPATATVTNYTVIINSANPTVFIRMVYP